MIIGYDRLLAHQPMVQYQLDDLSAFGCEKIFTDSAGGSISQRPGLQQVRKELKKGDIFVIWSLDRLGKSLRELCEWISFLKAKGVNFISLNDSINSSCDSSGDVIFNVFEALRHFEKSAVQERTRAGLTAARAYGRLGGRPPVISEEKKKQIVELYHQHTMHVWKLCKVMGISKPTLYKFLKESK